MTTSNTPRLDALIRRDPDIVDRMFDYLLMSLPELASRVAELAQAERALRSEFKASRGLHVRGPGPDKKQDEQRRLALSYPGQQSSREVARLVGVSAATVRRWRHQHAAEQVSPAHAAP